MRKSSFNFALCLNVIEHVPLLDMIEQARRVLAPNGILHLTTAERKYGLILKVLEKLRLKLPEDPPQLEKPKRNHFKKMREVG